MSPASYRTAPPRGVVVTTLRDRRGHTKSVAPEVGRPTTGLQPRRLLEVLAQLLLCLVVGGEVALLQCLLALRVGLLHALDLGAQVLLALREALGAPFVLGVTLVAARATAGVPRAHPGVAA